MSSFRRLNHVMVGQVNIAAAFHDHISCTKMSSQSTHNATHRPAVQSGHSGHQSGHQSQSSSASLPCETDHMYATESKAYNALTGGKAVVDDAIDGKSDLIIGNSLSDSNSNSDGMIGGAFGGDGVADGVADGMGDERSQIQKLTEMILAQLDLIQHQQEQLLKKDRQLQGLKQDREALCLRLEKMEKRIAVLTAKVNNSAQTQVNIAANVNNMISNSALNTALNSAVNSALNSALNSAVNSVTEADCDQSGSDTIIEDNNSVVGLLADPSVFTKLYSPSQLSTATPSNFNLANNHSDNNATISNSQLNSLNSVTPVRIKTEPNAEMTPTAAPIRKSRKRNSECVTAATDAGVTTGKKRNNTFSFSTVQNLTNNSVDTKKEPTLKESSSDSLSTTQSGKTGAKKKVQKAKCDSVQFDNSVSTLNCKPYVTKEILTTCKPYALTVNSNSQLNLDVSNAINETSFNNINNNTVISKVNNNSCVQKSNKTVNPDIIEVPFWRLHAVSSCYSLEGTENLDDEVFNRRHAKLEIDERRRKRWDIQRLREQRHNEKLRTGRYYSGSLTNCIAEKPPDLKAKNCEFDSFFPDPKNVQSIEVTEKLPLIAFGHPIPRLPSKPFSLPWSASIDKSQTAATVTTLTSTTTTTSSTATPIASTKTKHSATIKRH